MGGLCINSVQSRYSGGKKNPRSHSNQYWMAKTEGLRARKHGGDCRIGPKSKMEEDPTTAVMYVCDVGSISFLNAFLKLPLAHYGPKQLGF